MKPTILDGNHSGASIMKKFNSLLITVALITLTACGGRNPNPVPRYQMGDEKRSCEGLKIEIAQNEQEIIKLLPREDATGKNVALGAAGVLFIVPFFFMDFKDAEELEVKALRDRNRWLTEVASGKDCSLPEPKVKFEEAPAEKQ